MKNKKYLNIIGIFLATMLILASCKKDDPVKLSPSLSTWDIENITSESAEASGLVVAEGSGFSERGVCWNTTAEPTINDSKAMVDTVKGAVFTVKLTGLNYTTKYYVRAYAISNEGIVIYGTDTSFTTLIRLPIVSIAEVINIAGKTATSGGDVTNLGGGTVSARGLCWSKTPTPTIENDSTIDGSGAGEFVTNMTGLVGATPYYVRAYATNEVGTAYSSELMFTTLVSTPIVDTKSVKSITKTTATGVGYMWFAGGAPVTEVGVCWSIIENPTLADNSAASANLSGEFEANMTGLAAGTTYHMRAYATNSAGTEYGEDITFETIGEFFMVGSINGWNNHGQHMEYKGDGVFVAYQYITSSDQFKFFPVRDTWDNGWGAEGGDCGTAGTAVLGGGNICANNQSGFSADGFYEIKFSAPDGTVDLTLISSIGVIGDAQAGLWDIDVNLTFNQVTKVWEGQVTFLASGVYKFRADDDWAISFGGDLTDLTSNNGANIDTPGAGIYDVVLSLSGADTFNATVTLAK